MPNSLLSPASPDIHPAMKTIYDSTAHPPRKNGKGSWTTEEDQRLIHLVEEHGHSWKKIAMSLVGRNGKQCRERFVNHLDIGIKKGAWSKEEDEMLRSLQARYGNKWAFISTILSGRTACEVKNRFNATTKRIRKQEEKIKNARYAVQERHQISSTNNHSVCSLPGDLPGLSCSYYNHQHRLTLANSTMSSQNIPLKLDGTFMGIPHGNGNANAVSGASYTAPMMFKVGGARSPPRGPLLLWPSPSAAHPEKRRMISPLRLSDCRPMRVGASPSYNTSTFCASTIFDEFVAEDERGRNKRRKRDDIETIRC